MTMTITAPRSPVLRLHDDDNVLVAKVDLAAGDAIDGIIVGGDIPAGHKLAARLITMGEPIRKHSTTIGFAARDIAAGAHVHTHNLEFREFARDYAPCSDLRPIATLPPAQRRTFMGHVRPDGRVATRNYIAILSSVNCSATTAKAIERHFETIVPTQYPNVDGVIAFTHGSGCGMGAGQSLGTLRRIMAGYARHANVAGVLMVGLGCERNQIDGLMEQEGLTASDNLQVLNIQDSGGSQRTVAAGIKAIEGMLERANRSVRQPVDAGHIVLGLQCGGSDGYSAISANPALGIASDLLVAQGGVAILSETPEIYGVEHLLTRRAATPAVAQDILDLIEWWKAYSAGESNQMTNNPPPGNQAGGLASIFEKSLGSAMKGGTSPVNGVYRYGHPIDRRGLVFMDSPGFDPMSVTGQIASGANMIAFTTGRGSVFGAKPAPSIKLSTTTSLYQRMGDDIDVNCGEVLDGTMTLEEMGERIFAELLDVASGKPSRSEANGFGGNEFVPWVTGAAT
jgi:altronate hydrolase